MLSALRPFFFLSPLQHLIEAEEEREEDKSFAPALPLFPFSLPLFVLPFRAAGKRGEKYRRAVKNGFGAEGGLKEKGKREGENCREARRRKQKLSTN